jgi:LPS sulfotransferase NodH
MEFSYDLEDIKAYYSFYSDLMKLWEQKFPGKIFSISYEDLTANPDQEIRNLIGAINLDWHEECLTPHKSKRFIRTASNTQVREKIYRGSSDAWKLYKEFIERH